ncbi:hypothetical protein JX266_010277 [Neoarthrinium moseri]|nr:hypothetical protein JX266_010277 [Neoarthrinium moseri]
MLYGIALLTALCASPCLGNIVNGFDKVAEAAPPVRFTWLRKSEATPRFKNLFVYSIPDDGVRCLAGQLDGPPVQDCLDVLNFVKEQKDPFHIDAGMCWAAQHGGCVAIVCAEKEALDMSPKKDMHWDELTSQCLNKGHSGTYSAGDLGLETSLLKWTA